MSHHHGLVRLGMDLGLAVSDYNSHDTDMFDEIIKLSLAYVAKVKQAVMEGQIREDDIADYFALLGASWASIQPRVQNEYSVTAAHPPMADPHMVVAMAAAAAATAATAATAASAKKDKTLEAKVPEAKSAEAKSAETKVPETKAPETKAVTFSDVVRAPAPAPAPAAKAPAPAPAPAVSKPAAAPAPSPAPAKAAAPAPAPVLAKAAAEVAALAKVTDAFKKAASK